MRRPHPEHFIYLWCARDHPDFTAIDVAEEFAAWPIPATMEEFTEHRVRKTLTYYGVIAEGGAGLYEFTKAGRAIATAMAADVDHMAEVDSKLPSGTMRAVREERRRMQGRPGAE